MKAALRTWGRLLAFPVVFGGVIAAAIALLPRFGPPLTLVIANLGAIVAIVVAERVLPFRPEWNRAHGDVATDLLHALVSGLGTARVVRPLVQATGVVLAGMLSRALGGSLWPAAWPLVAQLALALLIAELAQYWLHRWQHERDGLWRFHAPHHSAPRLYWLNAARFHPVDLALMNLAGYAPLVVLGAPEATIMLFALFDAVLGLLQHSNIDVRLGPLNRVFSMAEVHRWHHSRTLREANTNYGSNLSVWDQVFGTFFLPPDREPPAAIGIADMPDFPSTYWAQLVAPFRWRDVPRVRVAP